MRRKRRAVALKTPAQSACHPIECKPIEITARPKRARCIVSVTP
jgi:hypothetical protein